MEVELWTTMLVEVRVCGITEVVLAVEVVNTVCVVSLVRMVVEVVRDIKGLVDVTVRVVTSCSS